MSKASSGLSILTRDPPADTPDAAGARLIGGGHVAIEEVHEPRKRGRIGIRRRRPIVDAPDGIRKLTMTP